MQENKLLMLSPVVLFVYNRPSHTEQTLIALKNNELANESVLYIFSDGPKTNANDEQLQNINKVREIIRKDLWCNEVIINESSENRGLGTSVYLGITEVINKYGKVIVLEDDLITSQGFLKYHNDALNLYQNDEMVMHISSFLPAFKRQNRLPETFFLGNMSCWGWSTWKRAWDKYNRDASYLYNEITKSKKILYDFNLDGTRNLHIQFEDNLSGKSNTWAIYWYSIIYLLNGLCLYPKQSLVENIGWDGSGTNTIALKNNPYKVTLIDSIEVNRIPLKKSDIARKYIKSFHKSLKIPPLKVRVKRKIKEILKSLSILK